MELFIGVFIALALIVATIIYINDGKNLIISVKMRTIEKILLLASLIIFLGIAYIYGSTWEHYLLAILAGGFLVVSVVARGLTLKGFRAMSGIWWRNWSNIKHVQITTKGKYIRVEFITDGILSPIQHIHYYKKEDYESLMGILEENIPGELIRIVK